jgi:hypothetical protein
LPAGCYWFRIRKHDSNTNCNAEARPWGPNGFEYVADGGCRTTWRLDHVCASGTPGDNTGGGDLTVTGTTIKTIKVLTAILYNYNTTAVITSNFTGDISPTATTSNIMVLGYRIQTQSGLPLHDTAGISNVAVYGATIVVTAANTATFDRTVDVTVMEYA